MSERKSMRIADEFYKMKQKHQHLTQERVDRTANLIIPLYYRLFPVGMSGVRSDRRIIISLTSFPARINTVWLTVESLLRQTYQPCRIILWLSKEEFPDRKLPRKLMEQRKRGLEIYFVSNLRSYKKFYYSMKWFPDFDLVIVDDDVFYSERMLELLVGAHERYPGAICCHRSRTMLVSDQGSLCAYGKWKCSIDKRHLHETPSMLLCPIGVGGVLIPAGAYDEAVLDRNAFMSLAPSADDLWLKSHSYRMHVPVIQLKENRGDVITIERTQEHSLCQDNLYGNENDKQMKAITDFYQIDWTPKK